MRAYNLGFISDQDIFDHVRATVLLYRRNINLQEFNKNIVDPIKLTFDAGIYGKSISDIVEAECVRQIDKSNTNHIGYFHQNLFRLVGGEWTVPSTGFDIVNEDRHIFVELKNKHNTMNSSSAQQTYLRMQNKLLEDDQATCILVEVIARKSCDEVWEVGGYRHNRIRRMSIDRFYELVFGNSNAFCSLCKALPLVLEDVLQTLGSTGIQNTVYNDLQQLSPDIFQSLYRLAFGTYNGFSDF